MDDLISRQAAIEELNQQSLLWGKEWDKALAQAVIASLPTIDPVKHGKWLLHEYPDGYYHTECSECGTVYDEKVYFGKTAHYCPNCGARMDNEGGDI